MTTVSRTLVVLAGTIVFTLSGGPSALTSPGGGHDDGAAASGGDPATRAAAVALAATGGARVTATEVGDEESYYEVEVTLDDGRQVDVQVDESFAVVGGHPDIEHSGEGAD
jgi:hypothetical protein